MLVLCGVRVQMAGESILVVDDSPVNLRLAAALLRSEGYDVHLASTAEEALVTLKTLKPAIILLDLQLPGHVPLGGASVGGYPRLARPPQLVHVLREHEAETLQCPPGCRTGRRRRAARIAFDRGPTAGAPAPRRPHRAALEPT